MVVGRGYKSWVVGVGIINNNNNINMNIINMSYI